MDQAVPIWFRVLALALVIPAVAAIGYAVMVGWAAAVYGGAIPPGSIRRKRIICAALVVVGYVYVAVLYLVRHGL